MNKVLITGANGFIGRALCEKMTASGYTARAAVRSRDPLQGIPGGIDVIEVGSIDDRTDWSHAVDGVDTIVHLAGRAHILKETSADPLAEYRRVNVTGTQRLADMAADAGVKRFVFISSIGVNGEHSTDKPFTENDRPSPVRQYAISKWEAEQSLSIIAREKSMETVILRPPLVYGPGVTGNMLTLMNYIEKQWPLPLAEIRNKRSFIGVGNLVDAILIAIERSEAAGQIFLVSDGEDLSTTELIQCIARHMHREARLFRVPPVILNKVVGLVPSLHRKMQQLTNSLVVDSTKFRSLMNWTPPYTINKGIEEMVSSYRTRGR